MGKKSLIKSTAKKKVTQTKKTPAKKSDTTTKTSVKTKKTSPKAKSAAKTKQTVKKPSPKKGTAVPKKLTVKELLFKKFEPTALKRIIRPADADQVTGNFTAPPFVFSDNDTDNQKIKKLLFNTYNMEILKAAAEKVAAEKVAAEKVAAEKAAAEKAAAEKAAAEKAAAEKAAAEKTEPMDRTIKFAAIGFGLIFIVLVLASISNSYKYYLLPADGAIEIWQGDFAPMGQKRLLSIPGGEMPQPTKPEYRKKEVFPLAFNYYISQADALAEVPGMPDFKGIKTYLHQALDYATDPAAMATANIRANTIELLVLLYKAQAAAGQATLAGLESAVDYLEEATMLDIDATQLTLVEEKIKAVNKMKAELAALQAAEAAAAEAEAAEEKAAEEAAAIEEANQAAAEESQLANEKNAVLANAPQVAAEEAAHTE